MTNQNQEGAGLVISVRTDPHRPTHTHTDTQTHTDTHVLYSLLHVLHLTLHVVLLCPEKLDFVQQLTEVLLTNFSLFTLHYGHLKT